MRIHAVYALFLRPFRRRRMGAFAQAFRPDASTTVLDVGGTAFNWSLLEVAPRVTLLNLDLPGDHGGLPEHLQGVRGSGTRLAFGDATFDVAFSNSVIEHVGGPDERRAFAREIRRVGRGVWVQTPARGFFIEPHLLAPFLHWLPIAWQRRLVRWASLWGWVARPSPEQIERFLDQTHLLGASEMRALFPDCELRRERFLGMTKSYVAVRVGGPVR